MTTLFEYPPNAAFGRVLPKNKIYEHATPSKATRALFVRQVEHIVWQYKLAPETVHIAATEAVPEIQIFSVTLKEGELSPEVLRCIDLAIPFPLLFELNYGDTMRCIATFKRPNGADASKWVIGDYFFSDWLPAHTPRQPLPVVFDLDALYRYLLMPLLPFSPYPNEPLQAQVERMERVRAKQRELARCESRLGKEKQFNRKVAINAERRILLRDIEHLTRPLSASETEATL